MTTQSFIGGIKMFKTWQEWHEFMKRLGATCTIGTEDFLLDGGCPKCKCKSWEVTSDGWAYCNGCHYGQSQMFHVSEVVAVYDICPDHPYGCPNQECKKKWIK